MHQLSQKFAGTLLMILRYDFCGKGQCTPPPLGRRALPFICIVFVLGTGTKMNPPNALKLCTHIHKLQRFIDLSELVISRSWGAFGQKFWGIKISWRPKFFFCAVEIHCTISRSWGVRSDKSSRDQNSFAITADSQTLVKYPAATSGGCIQGKLSGPKFGSNNSWQSN